MIPVSKLSGSPPFISHEVRAIWVRGSHNPNPRKHGEELTITNGYSPRIRGYRPGMIRSPLLGLKLCPNGAGWSPFCFTTREWRRGKPCDCSNDSEGLRLWVYREYELSCVDFLLAWKWWKFSGFQGFKNNGTCLAMLKLYEKLVRGNTGMWPFFASELL